VFQLLLRFYAPQSGEILFDGVDIADLDPADLRRNIALVAQDPAIFSGTIADNIRYGRPDASDDEVRRAAEAAAAAEFIERLPGTYGALVGERGTTLSAARAARSRGPRRSRCSLPLEALASFLRSLQMKTSMIFSSGSSMPP
jgi:ATP-binding cassette, subfamily B, bacterial